MNDPALPGWTFGTRLACCAPASRPAPPDVAALACAAAGSRRQRLWELDTTAHCPVVGVCLPMPLLRRIARKVLGEEPDADDYALHCQVVAEAKRRSPMAEAVQRELDQRFAAALRRTAALKTADALSAWWDEQRDRSDLPGALWATITHARCDALLSQRVLGQVHMLQHQVGMASRVEGARFEALIDENAVLARELAAAQRRTTRQAAEHAAALATWQAELVRQRGQRLAAESRSALLLEDLQALRDSVPELDRRVELRQRVAAQAERIVDLQRALQEARAELERQRVEPDRRRAVPAATEADAATAPATAEPAAALADRAVLCVGGRSSAVPVYRRLVEACGARFEHHDGGQQQSVHQLDHTLAAADLVICQAGCISHNAYWRIKDHCKRFGKRCIYVDNPSAASLQRALSEALSTIDTAAATAVQERPA
jgi:hypothetical protein